MIPKKPHPYGIRTANPTSWPQFPYNDVPPTPEMSKARYEIQNDWNQAISVRDGTKLMIDVYRPSMPGQKFPALCSFSPYTRHLQRESTPIGQNEAGIIEFWVPRGYAHIIIDVRGTNGSEGSWDLFGQVEQQDFADIIEWVAEQPWCNGNVGMMGCSYLARTQNMAAILQPPSLKAIFPYDAGTDAYRDSFFSGGIPKDGFARTWFASVETLNASSGRNPNVAGIRKHIETIFGLKYPLDGPFYQERSAYPKLDKVQIPAYFGCDWKFYNLHLRGAFDAWQRTGKIIKRMLIGPKPLPWRPFSCYHMEALRWYDHFLKGMDTGILEGAPIQLWIQGKDIWREENEWPLKRTQWIDFFLSGDINAGTLSDTPPLDGQQTLVYDPISEQALWGRPRWIYRSEPLDQSLEITGPIQLNLTMASTAEDTDWIAMLIDEAPDGGVRELTRGWLRSSHRDVSQVHSRPNEPWHPHNRIELLTPNKTEELAIGLIPTSNLFKQGHRIRLELSNCDNLAQNTRWLRTLPLAAENTVIQGRGKSRIVLPVIPQ